jgi:hypothetical protein
MLNLGIISQIVGDNIICDIFLLRYGDAPLLWGEPLQVEECPQRRRSYEGWNT